MAGKRIRVSADDTTYYTLPGNTGEKSSEVASVNDTVYGQTFESNSTSLGQWNVSANGLFKGIAGYEAVLRKTGTPTSMTGEATTQIGSTKSYQITAAARRVIDYTAAVTVLDGATNVTAQVESIDYLNGIVTFRSSYTVLGAVTVTGTYMPLAVLAKARNFSLTQNAAEIDETAYEDAQANEGNRIFSPGLRTVSLEVGGIYRVTNGHLDQIYSRDMLVIDVAPAGDANTFFRGFFKLGSHNQSGDVGALEEETVTYNLFVPDGDLLLKPYSWYINSSSTINPAIKVVLDAWANETKIYVQYLPDGTTGVQGEAIVTECSLSNAIDGLNEFRFGFRGSGNQETV